MTKQWFIFASRDLKVAKLAAAQGTKFKNEIAFHTQQCIEKAMKGYLVYHGHRPPKTHKINELAKVVVLINPKLKPLFRGAMRISKYAVIYRYPDAETKPVTFARVSKDLKLAGKIYDQLASEAEI